MKSIDEVLKNQLNGEYYGKRILLPFACEILKVVIDREILMDFSPISKQGYQQLTKNYTELYIYDCDSIDDLVSKYEIIKLVVVEDGNDIFNRENHIKLSLNLAGKHILEIKPLDKEILFIE